MASTVTVILLFAVCLTTGINAAESTPFTSCKVPNDPIDFRLDGCTEPPCILYKGDTASAEWDFELSADTRVLTPRVRGIVFGLSIPYDIGQENACDTLTNAECPLDVGERVTYALSMPVLAAYPSISLAVEFSLLDDKGVAQVCFRVDARVADR